MRINLKSSLKRIEELSNYTSQKGGIPVIVSLEDWIEGSYEGSFHDYVTKLERNNPNSTIIVDDMLLETDMYLPSYIFLDRDKRTIEKFIDLAENNAEEEYMKAYIEIFDEEFGIAEPDLKSWVKNIGEYDYRYDNPTEQEMYNNSLKNRHQENCNIIKEVFEKHEPMLADLFINYKRLSVHELVERYKDEKWFTGKKI